MNQQIIDNFLKKYKLEYEIYDNEDGTPECKLYKIGLVPWEDYYDQVWNIYGSSLEECVMLAQKEIDEKSEGAVWI